jgi:hypothetical protein
MAVLPKSVDNTDRDFDSLRLRIQNLIGSVFPDWTIFQVTNFGNILYELFAFVGDVLTFYQDNQAGESRIATAAQRKNLIALSKLLGFEPAGAAAATVEETLTLSAPPVANVTIPAGSRILTASVVDPVAFQLLADVTILAAASPPTATEDIENSESQQEAFASSGLPDQAFGLTFTPFIDGSATIAAGDGAYTEVDNFLASTATDRHFTVIVDQNDRATTRFGNAINGTIPSGVITVTYKTGGGKVGNVEAGTLDRIEGAFTDDLGNPVVVSVTNVLAAAGGVNRQSVEQIRIAAPASLRVLNRTVSKEDYEINARAVPGVARALMATSNELESIAENSGLLFVIPDGGGVPSQALKDDVLEKVTVEFPNTLTFQVEVRDPVFNAINVAALVFLAQGANAITVLAAIQTALQDFFAVSLSDGTPNPNVDFGVNVKDAAGTPVPELAWSDVFNAVRDVAGVRKIGDGAGDFTLNGARADVILGPSDFPQLGTITITDGDTSLPL